MQCPRVCSSILSSGNVAKQDPASELLGFWTCPPSGNRKYKKTHSFGNRICFLPQVRGRKTPTLSSADHGNTSSFRNCVFSCIWNYGRWTQSTNPVINSECYTPSSESVRFNKIILVTFTQSLTEMSTRSIKIIKFLGRKVRRVCKADNLTAIYEPTV
jgi:hypothetical protein